MPDTIRVAKDAGVAHVTLARPHVRNALDAAMIGELTTAFAALGADERLRAVVLAGDGPAFCGGADIAYMRESLDWGADRNYEEALRLSDMFAAIDVCPAPVIARVHGAALGGGAGLAAVCDVVVSADDALFGFTETKLGIVPAVISPFVLRKIGPTHARALFPTGERFDAARALRIGLVHHAVPVAQLPAAVDAVLSELRSSGPQAARAAKAIARTVSAMTPDEARTWTAARIAELRAGDEGQEGLRAFLDKRKPAW